MAARHWVALCAFALLVAIGSGLGGAYLYRERVRARNEAQARAEKDVILREGLSLRKALFEELQPVRLTNCELERFGEAHDGGYLVCGNLLADVKAGYSYGISGYDGWGCDVATRFRIPVHQFDCFDLRQPVCPGGGTQFHAECVGPVSLRDGADRIFGTMKEQFMANGDADRRLVVKIDVEGGEWAIFAHMEESVLSRIDQLVVEFHGADDMQFLSVIRRLKEYFMIAHLHYNNFRCDQELSPLPGDVYEVLFVAKGLAQVDASAPPPPRPHRLDAPNNAKAPDCQ